MNQILDYSPRKNGKSVSTGNKGGAKIFAIFCIIFAMLMIVKGVYGITSIKKSAISGKDVAVDANISVEVIEEEGKAIIRVTHNKGIEKVIYNWNVDREITIKGGKEFSIEETIELPNGENELYIKVIDVNNHTTSFNKSIKSTNGSDIQNPKINILREDKKLRITAEDDTAMAFITYRWNEEEEVTISATSDNQKVIATTVDVPIGANDITVEAVDKSNNTARETKQVIGLAEPEINLVVKGNEVIITVTHINGISRIDIDLNGEIYFANYESQEEKPKNVELKLPLTEGYNLVKVKATSVNNTYKEVEGQCNYNSNPQTNTTNTTSGGNTISNTSNTNSNTSNTANTIQNPLDI